MTLSSFAGSLLMALGLASLSALVPPTPHVADSSHDHELAASSGPGPDAPDMRLASAGTQRGSALSSEPIRRGNGIIVPAAGEFIPGAEQ